MQPALCKVCRAQLYPCPLLTEPSLSIEDKERWITECHRKMEEKYLKDCDMTIPLCWVTATISRLIMSKMWLIVYHPYQRKDGGASLPQATKDRLFITSLENVEYSILLETEARTMKWGWLFRTYVQWHAIAFLLSELCVRTKGAAVERAWRALEATAGRWWFPLNDSSTNRKGQQGCLWMPLRKLLAKARAAREREMMLEKASLALQSGQNILIPSYFEAAASFEHAAATTSPSASLMQPSSENLDRLLRPSAPKLGETVPMMSPVSWADSPSVTQTLRVNGPATGRDGDSFVQAQRHSQSQQAHKVVSPGQAFNDMTNFGFDNVMLDIMAGTTYDGTMLPDYAQLDAHHMPAPAIQPTQPVFPPTSTSTTTKTTTTAAAANLSPSATAAYRANADVDVDVDVDVAGTWPSDMAVDGAGNIDWTMWDDMVSQYGIEGQAGGTNGGVNFAGNAGSGHMGLMQFL